MEHILIVDDILYNRILLTGILNNLGFKTLTANNGKEAIDKLNSQNIDVVLLDIEMPIMNGLETIHHIRTSFNYPQNKILVFALTGHEPEILQNYGFNEIITKPYNADKILTIINKYLMTV